MDIRIDKNGKGLAMGFLGPVSAGDKFVIHAKVPLNFWGIDFDGRRVERAVKLRSDRAMETSPFSNYRQRVLVAREPSTDALSTGGQGVLILLEWDHPTFFLHNVTIFVDAGDAYAVLHTDGPFAVYHRNTDIVVPEPLRWQWGPDVLETIIGDGISRLPPFSEYKDVPVGVPVLAPNEGFVRWWDDGRGRGVLATNAGDVFVHRNDLVRLAPRIPRTLDRYSVVTFERLEAFPEKRSTLTHRAQGVRPLPEEQLAANG